jgi:hypothetical protein
MKLLLSRVAGGEMEEKNQQLHIIKECQMCHTQFSVAARQKSTFCEDGIGKEKEKHISSATERK